MLPLLMNLPGTHHWQRWTSAVSGPRAWWLPFRLPLPHWYYPLSSYCHWTSSWHYYGHQLATAGGLGAVAADFPHNFNSCLPAQYAEESHHQQPWELCPPLGKQRIPWCQREWSCHPHQLCWRHWRWPASPHHTSPGFPKGQSNWTARRATSTTGANECGPRVATYDQGHYGLLSQRTGS